MRKPTKTICVALCLMVISVVLPVPKAFGAVAPNQDLTAMSATMVFSIVSDMMRNPYGYVGETIKMKGLYSEFLDNTTGKTFHTCIVKDATACCAQGIEFELPEGVSYPPVDSEITIVGTMDTYRMSRSKSPKVLIRRNTGLFSTSVFCEMQNFCRNEVFGGRLIANMSWEAACRASSTARRSIRTES